ncbi:Succinyl-CoA:(R)-benzylsuccinate CoA-transferase subunit BbsF (plasmid) [Roseovarius sp. THAF8]|uniref:CaiB/BaiF CoA transferase family protein n=1 Tax=Roseovarius sp. THAF8 TaxID=2587846 RepID=UPI001268B9F2|nr:CaiB/BaiF CoA-transferase family protein [Roseovarius sp. THAF8]QFT99842.1 Succinyl-CoA:(R)-benzylsuccinate CoA-transferase subunit BbsF [Roseovarius sp. THAF8]
MTKPLEGVKVLDLSRILAGPWSTQIMADMGAEILKVERPGTGDDTRDWGPPFLKCGDGMPPLSTYFVSANRGKRSVAIDIAKPEGAVLVQKLAAKADVVVENFKVGGLEKYSLDYSSLSEINPRLVYCSISGFGQTGPKKDLAGYDLLAQAMGGMMSVTGDPAGEPYKAGPAIADVVAGLYATVGILGALREASVSGRGQHVDVSLFESQLAALAHLATNCLGTGRSPARTGNAHPTIVPYQSFETSDGRMVVAVGNDGQFRRLAHVCSMPELAADPRFATNEARVIHRAALLPILVDRFLTRGTVAWIDAIRAEGIPCGPINSIRDALAEPHTLARGMVLEFATAGAPIRTVATPIRFSRTPNASDLPPPALGQDTETVLHTTLGLTEEEIGALRQRGVI